MNIGPTALCFIRKRCFFTVAFYCMTCSLFGENTETGRSANGFAKSQYDTLLKAIAGNVGGVDRYSKPVTKNTMAGLYHNQSYFNRLSIDLYLFTDLSYSYLRGGDVMPVSILETGQWKCRGRFVVLRRASGVKALRIDHKYIVVRYKTDVTGFPYLVGIETQVALFRSLTTDNDPQQMFLGVSLRKFKSLNDKTSLQLRSRLLEQRGSMISRINSAT